MHIARVLHVYYVVLCVGRQECHILTVLCSL